MSRTTRIVVVLALVVGAFAAVWAPASARAKYAVSVTPSKSWVIKGHKVTLHGKVSPKDTGARVHVQRLVSGRWHTVASPKLNKQSKYAVAVALTTAGTAKLRVLKPRGKSRAAGQSRVVSVEVDAPLTITTSSLPTGVAGLNYLRPLAASGGHGSGYSWSATGLPAGLTLSSGGVLDGTVTTTGTSHVVVTVRDAAGDKVSRTLALSVPDTMPGDCLTSACSDVTPDGATHQISADQVVSSTTDPTTGSVTGLTLSGVTSTVGDVLVVAPTDDLPSGVIVVVDTVTDNGDGTETLVVEQGGPADAYADGVVKTDDPSMAAPRTVARASSRPVVAEPTSVACSGSATADLNGLSVTPSVDASIAALWKHPLFGGGGFYIGTGGLSLFQADVTTAMSVHLGVSISAAGTCTVTFPTVWRTVAAGDLGAVIFKIEPSATLKVTGKVDLETSATLTCGAEARWSNGTYYPTQYCAQSHSPLQLSNDSGVDATLSGRLKVTATLDNIAGVTGTLTPSVHAGWHPAQKPAAEVDAKVDGEATLCLGCLFKDAPNLKLWSGTIWGPKTLWSSNSKPPAPPSSSAPSITTTSLPAATVGQPYAATLHTADNRNGTWGWLPPYVPPAWLHLNTGDGQLSGTPGSGDAGVTSLAIKFTDGSGRNDTASIPLTVAATGGASDGGTWTTLAAGGDHHTCGIKTDGTAWCWGLDSNGEVGPNGTLGDFGPVVSLPGTWTVVSTGWAHTCGIQADGTAWCWGMNQEGELGPGGAGTLYSTVPLQVPGTWANLSAGNMYTCGTKTDGTAWCWGGVGSATPLQVPGTWTSISAGYEHTCGIESDGTAWCWGFDSNGEVGPNGTLGNSSSTPLQVPGTWTSISAGYMRTCGIKSDGTAWCWGDDGYSELGPNGTQEDVNSTPLQVPGTWNRISSGGSYTCGIKSDGSAWCWGLDSAGELGPNGTLGSSSSTPLQVPGAWGGVSTGWADACGTMTDGTAWCWGDDEYGQLGPNGISTGGAANPTPVPID